MDEKDEKSKLDVEKLELEIRKLKRPWLLEPSYLTLFITIISIIVVYRNGFFDFQKQRLDWESQKLEDKKTELASEVKIFEDKIDSLKSISVAREIELGVSNEIIQNTDSSFNISINILEEIIFNNPNLNNKRDVLKSIELMKELRAKRKELVN